MSRYNDAKQQLAYEKGYNEGMDRAVQWIKWTAGAANLLHMSYIVKTMDELSKMKFKENNVKELRK